MNSGSEILHAVLLAGGRSTRMGVDKCLLDWHGTPLWHHQIETLGALHPAQIHIAAPVRPDWLPDGVRWCQDSHENAGPLGGLHAALTAARPAMLAVLAVDLPEITPDFLRGLIAQCNESAGCVPESAHGFEPLAAVYPSALAESAGAWMAQGNRGLQGWLAQLCHEGKMRSIPVAPSQNTLFLNLNYPSDLEAGIASA